MPTTKHAPSAPPSSTRLLALCVANVATLLLTSTAAHAQPAKPPAPSLTRDELRACMNRQDANDQRRLAYERSIRSVNQQGESVQQEGNELAAAQSKVDTKSAAAVNAFKQRIAAYEGRAAAYEARAKELQQENAELQNLAKAHKAQCTDRPFLSFDRDAVMAERAAAASAAAAAPPPAASAPPAKKKR